MDLIERVDHLVMAGDDLQRGIDEIEQRLGVRPDPGGRHPNWGTWNASVALGHRVYLEVIAPDPDSDVPSEQRPGIFNHQGDLRLNGWVAGCDDIDCARAAAAQLGVEFGEVIHGSRRCPDGRELRWLITDPLRRLFDGIVPVLIDWGDTPHPAASAPTGCRLCDLSLEHPDADAAAELLDAIGIPFPVLRADVSALRAKIESPAGIVELC